MARRVTTPAFHYHPFVRRLAASLKRRCGLEAGSRVLLAVSGGADSMALMHAVALLAPRREWRLVVVVAHVQHHLRSDDEAEGDALTVARSACALRLPYVRADLDPDAPRPLAHQRNIEAWARHARYEALALLARSFNARAIVTAHHADDQLETILMRLVRGAALRGLSAIPWRRSQGGLSLLRPMLHHTRAEAEAFLQALNVPWRTDATNADVSRLRAKLRHDVTPALREISPLVARRAAQAADQLRRVAKIERAAIELASRACVERSPACVRIDRAFARTLPKELLAGLLREELARAGVSGDATPRALIHSIVRAMRDHQGGTRRFSLRGGDATLTRESLCITMRIK